MKKNKVRFTILLGVLCAAFWAGACWHAVNFNDSRLVVPMDFSDYAFRLGDLPMILALLFFLAYLAYLILLAIQYNRRQTSAKISRKINPKLGFLGFFGFLGFLGFFTYSIDKSIFPFLFFMFFGFFGFFWEGKMSGTFMDERYRENRLKAQCTANRVALSIIFLAALFLGQGRLMKNPEYILIALLVVISLSFALDMFLAEYLLYRWDQEDQPIEEEG